MINNPNVTVKSILSTFGIALQHVLIALPAIVAVPVLFGAIVGLNYDEVIRVTQISILLSGVMTVMHGMNYKKFGSDAPMIFGADIAVVAVGIRAASQLNLRSFFLVMGVGAFVSWGLSYFWKRRPKVISSSVVVSTMLIYSISLLPVALDWFLGGVGAPDYGSLRNILVGAATLGFTLFLSQYGKGILRYGSIGLGIIFGFTISLPLGMVKWSEYNNQWLSIPEILPYMPSYSADALYIVFPIIIVLLIKQFMDLQIYSKQMGLSDVEEATLFRKGTKTNAIGFALSFLLGAMPTSAQTLNFGVNSFLNRTSKKALMATGFVLILVGLVPKLSSNLLFIPLPVLGAIGFLLIASLFNMTIETAKNIKWSQKSIWVISLSFLFGLITLITPEVGFAFNKGIRILLESGICVTFFTGLFLEFVVPEN